MYRRILLCYDGSAEGRKALREGAELAISMRAEAYLLSICRSMVSSSVPEGVTPELVACEEDLARALLGEGVEWLEAHGLRAQGELAIGDPLRLIPEVAARIGADLIVVGHRPRGRLARWWSDSAQHTLLDLVSCSILVAMNARHDEDAQASARRDDDARA
jgi:nucleotide-binding universal stress UspA family protein